MRTLAAMSIHPLRSLRRMEENLPKERDPDPWCDPLLAVAASRDRAAFRQLFDHFAPQLKSFGAVAMSSAEDARHFGEELVQEVMITVWNKAHLFDPNKASVKTWIFAIARNRKIDLIRKIKHQHIAIDSDDVWAELEDPNDHFASIQAKASENRLQQAIEELPPDQVEILKVVYIGGKSHAAAATQLNIPLGTVKSRIRLALDKLKLSYREEVA